MKRVDIVVVGLGSAGAAAAWHCARRGMTVVGLDRRALGDCGARWVNGVAGWQLEEAEIPRPTSPEVVSGASSFHLVAGHGPERIVARGHGVLDIDMRRFGTRLQDMAKSAGAELYGECKVVSIDGGDEERQIVATDRESFSADHDIVATGLHQGLVDTPAVDRKHLCAAAQGVYQIEDKQAAEAFFSEHQVSESETLCFTGVEGGYSILNLRWHGDDLSILTGSIPADGYPSGRAILESFVDSHGWVGEQRFGGSRAIPLRRPYCRLANTRLALVGDAACQVFSAHGSGVGLGVIAARLVADSLEQTGGLREYEVKFHRRFGGLLMAYDAFRQFSQTLTTDDVGTLIKSGLLEASSSSATLAQRWPTPNPAAALKLARSASSNPRLTARLLTTLGRMATLSALGRSYPCSDGRALTAWAQAVSKVFGDEPDPTRLRCSPHSRTSQ